MQFGLVAAARVRRWLRDGAFDVVHVHEPAPPSLSLLACMIYDGPLVATFHLATVRSRFLSMFDSVLQPFLEKLSGRIAVSAAARKVIVEHLGADAVVIPNGVAISHFSAAAPLPGLSARGRHDRLHRPLRRAAQGHRHPARRTAQRSPRSAPDSGWSWPDGVRPRSSVERLPAELAGRIDLLGQVSEPDKARMLRSVDVYCAPNTGQESFGMILLEAMAARTPIVASDLEAFRRVLGGGTAGALFPVGDSGGLARTLSALLDDPQRGPHSWPTGCGPWRLTTGR